MELETASDQVHAALGLLTYALDQGILLDVDRWLLETAAARLRLAGEQLGDETDEEERVITGKSLPHLHSVTPSPSSKPHSTTIPRSSPCSRVFTSPRSTGPLVEPLPFPVMIWTTAPAFRRRQLSRNARTADRASTAPNPCRSSSASARASSNWSRESNAGCPRRPRLPTFTFALRPETRHPISTPPCPRLPRPAPLAPRARPGTDRRAPGGASAPPTRSPGRRASAPRGSRARGRRPKPPCPSAPRRAARSVAPVRRRGPGGRGGDLATAPRTWPPRRPWPATT